VTRHLSNYLFCLAVLISLAGCYLPPNYAYGNLFVLTSYTSDSYSVEVGACKGEILTLRWNVGEGKNPTLMASPTQNIEPQLPSRVANSGEIQVVRVFPSSYAEPMREPSSKLCRKLLACLTDL
jgi:hypothetical protein